MSEPTTLPQPQGLLLTGEGLSSMTSERLQILGEMVGGLGLKVTAVRDLGPFGEYIEGALHPIPATRKDFQAFAAENEYTSCMGHRSFNTAMFTGTPRHRYDNPTDHLPAVLFDFDKMTVELRSVYRRLIASDMNPKAWHKCGKGMVKFLAHIVNDRVHPEELLPVDTSREHRKG